MFWLQANVTFKNYVKYFIFVLVPSISVTVYEATSRLGGWIQTTKQNDLILEHGPRTIRPVGPQGVNTLELIENLGLTSKIKPIPYGHPSTKNRMIYVDGKLMKLPTSMKNLFIKQEPFDRYILHTVN